MEDYYHPDLKFPNTGKLMQLDVFIPSISVALEYQGIQHYKDMFIFGAQAKDYQARDQMKRIACQEASIYNYLNSNIISSNKITSKI
jgi:hypothetical protein